MEIVEIVRKGLTEGCDISQLLRDIDVTAFPEGDTFAYDHGTVELSADYLGKKGRA